MDCGICANPISAKRKARCASCAKATLYGPRIEQAASLLGREKAHAHVQAIVRPGNDGILAALPEDADWDAISDGVKSNSVVRTRQEREAAESRIKDIAVQADQLKKEMDEYRSLIASRKEANLRRRKQLEAGQAQIEKEKAKAMEPIHAAIKKAEQRLRKVNHRTAEAQNSLCQEASSLSGLQKTRLSDNRTGYLLHGLPIPSLRDLNGLKDRLKSETIDQPSGPKLLTEPHELISASMDNICRFLGLCCHYLSTRLPAEIILPHNGFPHAAILPIGSSYKWNISDYQSLLSSNLETAEKNPNHDISRPRFLQLDRPLPQLQKDNPKAAILFIEGVSLLAYNLAWLHRTHRLGSLNAFEELCDVGRTLHQIFPGKDAKPRPGIRRTSTTAGKTTGQSVTEAEDGKAKPSRVGKATSAQESASTLPEWKLSITKFVDQLKAHLRGEIARAEWHIIDNTEWDEELEDERPVFVGGMKREPAMSVMTVKPSDGDDDTMFTMDKGGTRDVGKGRSGWMKVKGRAGTGEEERS